MKIISTVCLSYLLGSIPFGFLVSKYFQKIDIREYGSGNIGASNIFRILGFRYAILVMIGDCLKGYLSLYLVRLMHIGGTGIYLYLLAGLFAIAGHNWSIFLKLRGGKGIATTFGVVLFLYPIIAIISALIWLILVIILKFASVGSLIAVLSMFILSFIFNTPIEFKFFTIIINIWAIVQHRSNIIRLIQRRENKIIPDQIFKNEEKNKK